MRGNIMSELTKDIRGVIIIEGDRVIYGKSCRYNPIKMGTVQKVDGKQLTVLGDGNSKPGVINNSDSSRVLVLPSDY